MRTADSPAPSNMTVKLVVRSAVRVTIQKVIQCGGRDNTLPSHELRTFPASGQLAPFCLRFLFSPQGRLYKAQLERANRVCSLCTSLFLIEHIGEQGGRSWVAACGKFAPIDMNY